MMEIISPSRREHAGKMIELIGKVFSEPAGYFCMRDFARNNLFYGPYDWEASRIGLLDGRIVAHWGVWGYTMRIGSARVRVGGVGCVTMHADYRKRGLMEQTAWASINAMREAGYDMTMLFGIDDYYDRFGYVNAWADGCYCVQLSDMPSERPTVSLKKFALRRWGDIARLYNRQYARFTGTAVRPTFLRIAQGDQWRSYRWNDAHGKVAGYVVAKRRRDAVECIEQCGDPEKVLRVLAMLARRWRCKEVRFTALPYHSLLCRRLRQGNSRAETYFKRSGGPMIRTLNLRSSLGKLTKELSRRLKKSHVADWQGELLIADRRERVALAIDRSRVEIAAATRSKHTIRGGEHIAQLIIGANEPGEIVEAAGIKVTGDARKLIAILFPNQHPQLCGLDRY